MSSPSSSGPYSISLLNDLHHHFPDLLYAPGQFQTVQQVLNYIVRVAQQNTYDRESARYRSSRPSSSSSRFSFSASSSPSRGIPVFSQRTSNWSSFSSSSPHDSISIHRTTIPLASMFTASAASAASSASSNDESGVSLAYLASLLQLLGTGDSSNASANHPTQQEIEQNTVVRMISETQDECCAICHEAFEEGQEVRHLRHCSHIFHLTCIDTWFTSHSTCPNCRRDIRQA